MYEYLFLLTQDKYHANVKNNAAVVEVWHTRPSRTAMTVLKERSWTVSPGFGGSIPSSRTNQTTMLLGENGLLTHL